MLDCKQCDVSGAVDGLCVLFGVVIGFLQLNNFIFMHRVHQKHLLEVNYLTRTHDWSGTVLSFLSQHSERQEKKTKKELVRLYDTEQGGGVEDLALLEDL
jgi:hypothetical protein